MKSDFHLNLLAAWAGILAGFLSGMTMGLFFHRDEWLGGYGSFRRRLYRLGHISLFALAVGNLCFYLTARELAPSWELLLASRAFVVGAVSMPVCCVWVAHRRQARFSFAVPVTALLAGATLTLLSVAGEMRANVRKPGGPAVTQVTTEE